MGSRNVFNLASLVMPLVGVAGFVTTAQCFSGRADGMTLLGVFMLPGEVFWISVILGTLLAVVSLVRHEMSRFMSWLALILNGVPAVWLGFGALMMGLKR